MPSYLRNGTLYGVQIISGDQGQNRRTYQPAKTISRRRKTSNQPAKSSSSRRNISCL